MSNPRNSSLDLPNRCLDLLDELWDVVANDQHLGARHGGPLSTTFLLSLAAPIVVLPTERILKQHPLAEGSVDDWHVDRDLADRIRLDFTPADPLLEACPFSPKRTGGHMSATTAITILLEVFLTRLPLD